jgi:hypothetical protein
VEAGSEREALLRIADRLCAELNYKGGEPAASGAELAGDGGDRMSWGLSADDESFVAAIRESLAMVAAAIAPAPLEGSTRKAVVSALDGAEVVMRGELLRGNALRLLPLMPSFVFLVTLPVAEHDRAYELSRRTSELIDALED